MRHRRSRPRGTRARTVVASLLAAALPATALAAAGTASAAPSIQPLPNPAIANACGTEITLVLDASGSIQSSNAVEDVRDAANTFLDSLRNTDSTARVTQFATFAEELAPATLVTDASLVPGSGVHAQAIAGYYNPRPPRPGSASIFRYDGGGSVGSDSNWDLRNGDTQYTNWDQALDNAAEVSPELTVFITDGEPTGYDLNGDTNDPDPPKANPGPPPDVGVSTNRGSADDPMLNRSIQEANRLKAAGSRVLAVGVGQATGSATLQDRLKLISGDQLVRDADLIGIDSLNDIDVAIVSDFEDLARFLRGVVLELCSPSLTITKLAQSPDDASYQPAPGWSIEVEPTVPPGGDSFEWVLPDTLGPPPVSKTVVTNANGAAQFQWEPDQDVDSTARITETLQPGFTPGRPASFDVRCEARAEDGEVRVVTGDLDGNLSFLLDPIGDEIVTCTIWNSFDYDPQIELTKVNAPTEVRGDLNPPVEVTSLFEVENPGNTPLTSISVTDDKCGPAAPVENGGFNVGDTNADGKLDPARAETWQFECAKPISTGASTDPAGQNIVNEATVTGTDPTGTTVTATATDDVDAFNPAISLTKLVDDPSNGDPPATSIDTQPGDPVVYSYAVANEGNTPLGSVSLADDTPPCENPVRGADAPGNGDDVLDVGETWTYSCDLASPTASVVNVATVSATPLNPLDGDTPFPTPNPPVTDTDSAEVYVVNADIALTKQANPTLLLLDAAGNPEPVTYSFTATNNGTDALTRPGGGDPKADDWVTDPLCSPVTFTGVGDDNANDLLDPGETWEFECGPVPTDTDTVNTATIVGEAVDDNGDLTGVTVTDTATARVEVVRPDIDVDKTTLRPVVLDPDAPAELGPDVPRRPAEYEYVVTNPGFVPLQVGKNPGDANAPLDDICSPLVFVDGDLDGDDLLDVDEAWTYECSQILERQQANTPPLTGAESGLVTNTVTVTGIPVFGGTLVPDKQVTDTSTEQTLVIEPSLTLTKTASAEVVLNGGEVTYTFLVENTGDVGLDITGPQDDKCAPLEFQDGDVNNNGILEGANGGTPETWRYTCTRRLALPAPPDTTDVNEAGVFGIDPLGNVYFDAATAEVRVFDPAIDLVKTVSETLVPVGTPVDYTFEVTNTGVSPLAPDDVLDQVELVDASDPGQPTCERPTFVGGDDNGDGLLDRDPAETWEYTCTATVDAPTTNIAVVGGVGGTGPTFPTPIPVPVVDIDTAFVQTFAPGIDVVKTADPRRVVESGEVTYTYEVTNTGDVPLAGVADRITDDTCSPVTYVEGDLDNDGLLDSPRSIFEDSADETWVFTCTTTVSETTTNTVTVPGTPTDPGGEPLCGPEPGPLRVDEPCDVTGTDTETVTVVEPGTIVIEKRTTPASDADFSFTLGGSEFTLSGGDSRTFDDLDPGRYTAVESGTDGWSLTGIECDDPSGNTSADVGDATADIRLAPGETVTCTFTNEAVDVPPLPETGADGMRSLVAASSLLVAAGATLMWLSRRRRTLT